MEKVAIYCRLSKEDVDKIKKGDESASVQNQKSLLIDYATSQTWSIYRIYSDDDYSGTDETRPDWNRMLQDAKLRKFSVILCKTQSRFTREIEAVEKYIHTLFPIWHIRFVSIVDHVDTLVKGNKKASQINGLINEWYVEDLSHNVRTVLKQKMKEGEYIGAFTPYGYKKDEKNKYQLLVDEEPANVVRVIYSMALEGYGITAICNHLTEQGILTPSEYKERIGLKYRYSSEYNVSKKYGIWSTTTVNRILHNETYIGNLVQHKDEKQSYKSKKIVKVPKEDWIIVEDTHEPIIEKEVFYQIQQVLTKRRKLSDYSIKSEVENYYNTYEKSSCPLRTHIFAGIVKCKECSMAMHKSNSNQKEKKFEYLRCSLAIKSKNVHCTPHRIRYDILYEKIKYEINKRIEESITESRILLLQKEVEDNPRMLQLLLNHKLELKEQLTEALAKLYLDKVNNYFTDEEFLSIKQEISKKRKNLMEEINKLEKQLYQKELTKVKVCEIEEEEALFTQKEDAFTINRLTRKIVLDFIHLIEISENEEKELTIFIHWNF